MSQETPTITNNHQPQVLAGAGGAGEVPPPAVQPTDRFVYRAVVIILGLIILFVVASTFVLTLIGRTALPEGLIAIGSTAAGGLVGLLAPSPMQSSKP